jgi:hypothetical protein
VNPLNLIETEPGAYSLTMYTGQLPVDPVVHESGHVPNGPFWDGVAEWLVRTRMPALDGRFEYDSEGGMFCAYGSDRVALEELRTGMTAVATGVEDIRELIAAAEDAGFEFDD